MLLWSCCFRADALLLLGGTESGGWRATAAHQGGAGVGSCYTCKLVVSWTILENPEIKLEYFIDRIVRFQAQAGVLLSTKTKRMNHPFFTRQ